MAFLSDLSFKWRTAEKFPVTCVGSSWWSKITFRITAKKIRKRPVKKYWKKNLFRFIFEKIIIISKN